LIPLHGVDGDAVSVARVPGTDKAHAFQFRVGAGGRDYLFCAESAESADGWVRAIEAVIDGTALREAEAAEAAGAAREEAPPPES
jgi:hypothetical protein